MKEHFIIFKRNRYAFTYHTLLNWLKENICYFLFDNAHRALNVESYLSDEILDI